MKEGRPAGWEATVREIDHLASIFDEVIHIAPLHENSKEAGSAAFYKAGNVIFKSVEPAGGEKISDKIKILLKVPGYIASILKELGRCDIVHVRCPSNISLIALLVLIFKKRPVKRWIKYAGNWKPENKEPLSYGLQRFVLEKNFIRGKVTVNGVWPDQPRHVHSFLNPCISQKEWEAAKSPALTKKLALPLRLLFVGRVEKEKGAGFLLQIMSEMCGNNIEVSADIVGDGPQRKFFEKQAENLGLKNVRFWGWLSRAKLNPLYEGSHFIILPSSASEGWPKVLSEAMAFGVIPLASRISSIYGHLSAFKTGEALKVNNDAGNWASAIMNYLKTPSRYANESKQAHYAAENFTYEKYLQAIKSLFHL